MCHPPHTHTHTPAHSCTLSLSHTHTHHTHTCKHSCTLSLSLSLSLTHTHTCTSHTHAVQDSLLFSVIGNGSGTLKEESRHVFLFDHLILVTQTANQDGFFEYLMGIKVSKLLWSHTCMLTDHIRVSSMMS